MGIYKLVLWDSSPLIQLSKIFVHMATWAPFFIEGEREVPQKCFLIYFRNLSFSKTSHFTDIPVSLPWLEAVYPTFRQLAKDSDTVTQAIAGNQCKPQCKSSVSYCSRGPQVS